MSSPSQFNGLAKFVVDSAFVADDERQRIKDQDDSIVSGRLFVASSVSGYADAVAEVEAAIAHTAASITGLMACGSIPGLNIQMLLTIALTIMSQFIKNTAVVDFLKNLIDQIKLMF